MFVTERVEEIGVIIVIIVGVTVVLYVFVTERVEEVVTSTTVIVVVESVENVIVVVLGVPRYDVIVVVTEVVYVAVV